MQQHLRNSGALKTLKTQLRGMVLTELMHQQKHMKGGSGKGSDTVGAGLSLEEYEAYRRRGAEGRTRAGTDRYAGINDSNVAHDDDNGNSNNNDNGGDPKSGISQPSPEEPSPSSFASWSACVADAVVENHLRRSRRPMSLSIFSTEAEVAPLSDSGAPSEEERCLRQLLLLSPHEDVSDVSHLEDEIDSVDAPRGAASKTGGKRSVLQQLVEHQLLSRDSAEKRRWSHRHHCGTQTFEADKKQSEAEKNPLLSLECRLAAVDAKYTLTFAQLGRNGDKSFFTRAEVERRLQQYKADIHEQLRAEYEQKAKRYEANELQDVKDTLESRYQLLLKNKSEEFAEMQRSLTVKYEQDKQRLQQQRADVERRAMELDKRQSDMQKLVSDHELELAHREGVVNSLKDKLRVAQLQCAKWEELSGSRLMEADEARARERRRLAEMQRMRAEHAAEMRLKEEELSRLRFRVRTLLDNPNGGASKGEPGLPSAPDPRDRVNDDLYRMLVRTEELQRNTVEQQKQAQRQYEVELEERVRRTWDATWQEELQSRLTRPTQPQQSPPEALRTAPASALPPPLPSPSTAEAPVVTISPSASVAAPEAAARAEDSPNASSASSLSSKAAPAPTPPPPPAPAAKVSHSPTSSSSIKRSSLEDSPIVAPTGDVKSLSASGSKSSSKSGSGSGSSQAPSPDSAAEREGKDSEAERERRRRLEDDEREGREAIGDEEDTNRKGIEWSAKSQRSVVEEKERDSRAAKDPGAHNSGNDDDNGGRDFFGRLERQRQELRVQQEAADNVIFRDSDDDNDAILFGDKGDDTGSDF